MITYDEFKELFNKMEGEPEILIKYKDAEYMLIKLDKQVSYQKIEENPYEVYYNSIDDINLKETWNDIEDIIIDDIFSIKDDLDDILDLYK